MRAHDFVIGQQGIAESFQLDEDLGAKIDQWIEDRLVWITGSGRDYDRMTDWMRARVDRAAAEAPTEPVAQEVIDRILADIKVRKELERAAWQQKTTVEKIKAMLYAAGGKFIAEFMRKWQNMSKEQRQQFIANAGRSLLELVLIILRALVRSRK